MTTSATRENSAHVTRGTRRQCDDGEPNTTACERHTDTHDIAH
jgi:hypothetical protein